MENVWKALPKVELHRHLEGSIRLSTLRELAAKRGGVAALDGNPFQVLQPMTDLKSVLDKFMATQALLDSESVLTRITEEVITDAYNDGIRLLELRYAPTFILFGHPQLTFEKIHRAILLGIENCKHLQIGVGLICIFQRTLPLPDSERVLDFVRETRDTWIGVDLADNEQDFPARHFQKLFAQTKQLGLPCTIHAGEALHHSAAMNVIDAIKDLSAVRIGHGLQIIHHPEALKIVVEHKIPLELCPTSNWITNAIPSPSAHPFTALDKAGAIVTLNSDDPGIFGIELSDEYALLAKHFGVNEKDFRRYNDQAMAASFLPATIKQKFWTEVKK